MSLLGGLEPTMTSVSSSHHNYFPYVFNKIMSTDDMREVLLRYEDIPVEATGSDVPPAIESFADVSLAYPTFC